ncbi:MAG TPA: hypothetical protein VES73_02865 [Lamprocystis sp. (in: g-proteobacteria)]|nr:hypothetical protein [Lamprocystis sp. (in: g-proteobacteria)]
MSIKPERFATLVALGALLTNAGAAQLDGGPQVAGGSAVQTAGTAGARPFIAVTPIYQGNTNLDRGGDFSMGGVAVRGGVSYGLADGNSAGVALTYDHLDYAFSTPGALGPTAPWGKVQRFGLSVPLSGLVDGWRLSLVPSVDWFGETDADSGESLTAGATLSGSRQFTQGNRLGLGVGVFSGLEKITAFPFLIVDWRLTDRWRLTNPLASGPTGPAGLEIDYRFDGGWSAGIGAAWRVLRFRLSETGPTPNGIGEESGVPLFLRVTQRFGSQIGLHLYGGVIVNGELRVENSHGDLRRKDNFDPAPLFGATFTARF